MEGLAYMSFTSNQTRLVRQGRGPRFSVEAMGSQGLGGGKHLLHKNSLKEQHQGLCQLLQTPCTLGTLPDLAEVCSVFDRVHLGPGHADGGRERAFLRFFAKLPPPPRTLSSRDFCLPQLTCPPRRPQG